MIYVFTNTEYPFIHAILDGPDNVDMVKERKAWRDKNYVLKLPPKPAYVQPEIITSITQAMALLPISDWQKICTQIEIKLQADLAKEYSLNCYSEIECFLISLRRSKKYKDVLFKEVR